MLALSAKGDSVGVLRLVTAWGASGSLSPAAIVAEGRAYLELRLVDRAIARARVAIEAAPSDRAALLLLAEGYIDRGWPLRAKPVLDGLRSAGERVDGLVARMSADPPRPEANAREVEASGDIAARRTLAEQFMAVGSLTRATGILDRLAAEAPADARVRALRWAIAGDYSSGESVDAQVKRALPPILDLSAVPEDSEHTESLGEDGNLMLEPEAGEAAFPTLFKRPAAAPAPVPPGPDQPTNATEEEEKTATSPVPGEGPPPPVALASVTGGGAGDTQILMVVGEGEPGGMHRKRDEPGRTLNLREWQASMGVDPVVSDLAGVDDSEELSDRYPVSSDGSPLVEAVEGTVSRPAEEPVTDTPIEVIEKHPIPLVTPEPVPAPRAVREPPVSAAPTRPNPLLRLGLAAGFVAGFALVLGLLAMLLARATGLIDAARAGVDLGHVLASADYPALVEAEERLAATASEPAEQAELARARVVLWSEYDGNARLLEQVDALLAKPKGIPPHTLAFLRAAELLAFRNPASALAAIGREPPQDDEERLLLARIHAALGDFGGADADLAGILADQEPRYRLGRADILRAEGKRPEARAVVTLLTSEHPNLVAARLLELELREGTPPERAAAAAVFRKTYAALGLSPRQEGEAAWVEAQAWVEGGQPERALEVARRGVARDGTHRDLLMLLVEDDVAQNELVAAARQLVSLQRMYRADPELRTDLVLVDLDLDRIDEAAELAAGANPPLKDSLDALVKGWSGAANAPDPANVDPATPLGAYARAWLAVSGQRPDAATIAESAAVALDASKDPFLHRLATRTHVLAATVLPEPEAATKVAELRKSGLADAAAHVLIGRYCERVGVRAIAAQHFDRAADLEPELGWALYEKGRFYADAGDSQDRTTEAWRDYLALGPSGPRADRAKGAGAGAGR